MSFFQKLLDEYRENRARQHELALNENADLLRAASEQRERDLATIADLKEENADLVELTVRQGNKIVQLELELVEARAGVRA